MTRILLLVSVILYGTFTTLGQCSPLEGAVLNHRLVRFSSPQKPVGYESTLQIAKGMLPDAEAFDANILISIPCNEKVKIAEVPDFGTQYTWRIVGQDGQTGRTQLHHFSTGISPYTLADRYRLRVTQPASKYSDCYVMLDAAGLICDLKGQPIWYLPLLEQGQLFGSDLRDFKLSERGTITCLYKSIPYELDWNGNIIWSGHSENAGEPGLIPQYHHEFTIFKNGSRMVLGNEMIPNAPGSKDLLQYGTVLEMSRNKQINWVWRSSEIYKNTHYQYGQRPDELYDIHMNAFYFDKTTESLYVGFKNISQIAKIDRKTSKVMAVYGRNFQDYATLAPFYEQHSIIKTHDGYLCIFDNHNVDGLPEHFRPKISLFRETKGQLKPIWSYEPSRETHQWPGKVHTSGGSCYELSGGELFVSMCEPYADIFIVGRDKKLIWRAKTEQYKADEGGWKPDTQYRAFIASRKQLEQVILHRE